MWDRFALERQPGFNLRRGAPGHRRMRYPRFASALVHLGALSLAAAPALAADDPNVEAVVEKIFKHVDADKDGRISRAEASGRKLLAEHFDKIDADRDGFLSRDEIRSVVAKRMARKQGQGDF
jgi:Ca2+-binding EF-hand superfamily protein